MIKIRIQNINNPFVFEDSFCSSTYNGKLRYDSNPLMTCDVQNVVLEGETKTVKRTIEKKKLFKTVLVEVEETVTEHFLTLTYVSVYDSAIKQIKIVVLPTELNAAQMVVEHITSQLLLRKNAEEAKEKAKVCYLAELRAEEEERLKHCIYDLVVIDFETTGVKSPLDAEKYDEILSVSIIDQDGNVLLNSLCKPQRRKTWAAAQEIHGISPAMVKGQPTFEELFPQVKEILCKAKMVIAYNIAFEMRFLWGFDLEFCKPGGTQQLIRNVVWGPDPMLMYSAYKGTERWQKLTTAAKHFKYPFEAHDSLEDVKATLHCFKKMVEYVHKNPDKDYILKYGFLYDDGKKGKWFDFSTFKLRPDVAVEYADPFREVK